MFYLRPLVLSRRSGAAFLPDRTAVPGSRAEGRPTQRNGPAGGCAHGRGLCDVQSHIAGSGLPALDFGCLAASAADPIVVSDCRDRQVSLRAERCQAGRLMPAAAPSGGASRDYPVESYLAPSVRSTQSLEADAVSLRRLADGLSKAFSAGRASLTPASCLPAALPSTANRPPTQNVIAARHVPVFCPGALSGTCSFFVLYACPIARKALKRRRREGIVSRRDSETIYIRDGGGPPTRKIPDRGGDRRWPTINTCPFAVRANTI